MGTLILIPSEQLDIVFNTLPNIPGYGTDPDTTPKFEFGTHKDLLRFLKDETNLKNYPYPLIWLQTPVISKGGETVRNFECTLILATKTKASFSNRERLERTIKYKLKPLLGNILTALNQSGITRITDKEDYTTEVFYNYGNDENDTKQMAFDIWDVIRFTCNIELKTGCIRTINY